MAQLTEIKTVGNLASTGTHLLLTAANNMVEEILAVGLGVKLRIYDVSSDTEEFVTVVDSARKGFVLDRPGPKLTFSKCSCVEVVGTCPLPLEGDESSDSDAGDSDAGDDEGEETEPVKVLPTNGLTGEYGGLTFECGVLVKIAPNWPQAFFPPAKVCCEKNETTTGEE